MVTMLLIFASWVVVDADICKGSFVRLAAAGRGGDAESVL